MALQYNTFRPLKYLRTIFTEGRFLLASEASDLELEIIDQSRNDIRNILGDVSIDNAWKVSITGPNQLLVSPGISWTNGLPFLMKDGRDQLVSGSLLASGILPLGTTIADSDNGKVITFTPGVTPTNTYDVIITAEEQLIDSTEDLFLQNANLSEPTASKIRLVYLINVVPASAQTQTPIPYTNDTSQNNLVNQVIVTGSPGGNGEVIAINDVSGSETIDGRNVEVTLRNDPGLGGGNPIPNGSTDQQVFFHGRLLDSKNQPYYINAVFNDVISTQVIVRLSKEVGQPDPVFVNGQPFTLIKRDVYVTDDSTGTPVGKLFWNIAQLPYNTISGLSTITDLRLPTYSSDIRGSSNEIFRNRIGKLTDAVGDEQEDRSAYIRSDNTVTWSGSSLTFSSDIILELVNTKSGVVTQHKILASNSPLTLGSSGESIWVSINRTSSLETVTPIHSTITPIPAQNQANKDVFVLFRRIDTGGGNMLHVPLHKQLIQPAQTLLLGSTVSGTTFDITTVLVSRVTGEVLTDRTSGNILLA